MKKFTNWKILYKGKKAKDDRFFELVRSQTGV